MSRAFNYHCNELELNKEISALDRQIIRMKISHRKETEELQQDLKRKDYTISTILEQHKKEIKNTWVAGLSIGLAIGLILGVITSISW